MIPKISPLRFAGHFRLNPERFPKAYVAMHQGVDQQSGVSYRYKAPNEFKLQQDLAAALPKDQVKVDVRSGAYLWPVTFWGIPTGGSALKHLVLVDVRFNNPKAHSKEAHEALDNTASTFFKRVGIQPVSYRPGNFDYKQVVMGMDVYTPPHWLENQPEQVEMSST